MGLFYDVNLFKVVIKTVYKLESSIEFLTCADNKLTEWFYLKTGIKASKLILLGLLLLIK